MQNDKEMTRGVVQCHTCFPGKVPLLSDRSSTRNLGTRSGFGYPIYHYIKFQFQNLQKHLDKDYGVNEVFATLANNCFEFNDLEYTYKMCAFDYTAQKPLHGGSETRLGKYFEKKNTVIFTALK